ncbi:MAG: 8-oxo-dGTP diphosphatase MutT [Rhodospirillales bacterium]|nr:8-oxo-dGTP diphosphatase MutT [Rhodospirillales bacterium]
MLAAPPAAAPFAPLATERLTLRPLAARDAAALHNLVNDWEVACTLANVPFPYPREEADEWIAATERDLAAGAAYHLAITGRDGARETLVGVVGLRCDAAARSGRLGYWVGRRFWGHGVATEAAGRLARWAMANLDLDRLEATVIEGNPASLAVLRRIGFRQTGQGSEEFRARGGMQPVLRLTATRDDLFGDPATAFMVPAEAPGAAPAARRTGMPVRAPTGATTDAPVAPAIAPPIAPAIAPLGRAAPEAAPAAGKPLVLVAACALIDRDGRVLLARRPEGKTMAGLWEFPGGKLAAGETPEAALIRELKEELGIDVTASCLGAFAFASHAYERFHLLMPLYLCRRWRGIPRGQEGQTLTWVRPERLAEYQMPPADKPLIPLLRDFL